MRIGDKDMYVLEKKPTSHPNGPKWINVFVRGPKPSSLCRRAASCMDECRNHSYEKQEATFPRMEKCHGDIVS